MKKLLIFLCLVLVITLSIPAFSANKKTHLKQKLSTITKQIKNTRSRIHQKRLAKKEAYGDLRSIDDQIQSYQSKIARSQIQISKYENEVKDIDKNIALIEKNLNRRNSLLKSRVVDMYKGGDMQFVNVLLSTTDMWSFLTQSFYIKKLIEYDTNLIKNIKKDKEEANRKKAKRVKTLNALKDKQHELILYRNKQNALASKKKKEIESIKNDLEKEERAYRAEQESSNAIERQILALQSTPKGKARLARAFSGNLSLPCGGRITSRFGWRIHPIKHTRRMHTGVDIGAPTGTAIHCAGNGEVILSGWYGAYGKAVIVDHGGGVTTLYGHCSSLSVHNGQNVSKGQVIGRVGSTGWSTGPHCHYEKRINGKPVNPL